MIILLEDFEDFFGVNLGDWANDPVNLNPKPGSKPFNCKYYPVPIINKEIFLNDLKPLVEIGVLTLVQYSKYGTPVFVIPKKEVTVRFITDYHRLNHKLVRKPYSLPRIGNTIQKLEG